VFAAKALRTYQHADRTDVCHRSSGMSDTTTHGRAAASYAASIVKELAPDVPHITPHDLERQQPGTPIPMRVDGPGHEEPLSKALACALAPRTVARPMTVPAPGTATRAATVPSRFSRAFRIRSFPGRV
jgi:hypothetical protein